MHWQWHSGCSEKSQKSPKILILGCGVVGLNTGLRLQQDLPEAKITIMAERLGENVVSNVAAGFFRATSSIRGPTAQLTEQWLKDSWAHYNKVRKQYPQGETGISEVCPFLSINNIFSPARP